MPSELKSLSVVIPCYNEEEVIANSFNEIHGLLTKWKDSIIGEFEIVLVNNGSSDDTLDKMLKLLNEHEDIKVIDLRNNFGFQGSILAGLANAEKDMIVTIDADLQDDPTKIYEMVMKHYDGFDMVLGIRKDRSSDSFFKRNSAQLFYNILRVLGVNAKHNHGNFRLLSHNLVDDLLKYNEKNRFLRAMVMKLDNKYARVYYNRRKRQFGKSKFNLFSLVTLGLDGITSFSTTPIRIISVLGIFMLFISIILGCFVIYAKLFTELTVPGFTLTLIVILLFAGIQNFLIGIIGEYVSKIYLEVKDRPIYSIRSIYKSDLGSQ